MPNLTAFITGASRGIGFSIAKRLSTKSSLLLLCSKSESTIAQAKNTLDTINSAKIRTNYTDSTQCVDSASKLATWANKETNKIDLLVLNAGYYVEGSLESIDSNNFEENFRINFLFNHYLVQALLPLVKKSDLKRIVFIGSTAGYEPYPVLPTYGVAKWALRGYAINLRKELIKYGVGVTYVAPGGTLTDMWAGEDLPPQRLLDPDDVAKVVDMLTTLSPQAVVEEIIFRPILGDMHE